MARQTPRIVWAKPPLWIWLVAFAAGLAGLLVFAPSSIVARIDLAAAIHVAAAGLWAGGILAVASLRPPDGWRSDEARLLIDRFGGVAVIAFVVTVLTGLLRATEQLTDLSDLWTTSYGEVLAVKIAAVAAMLAISVIWRRGRPLPRADAAVAIVVIGATALLGAFPVQPHG